MTVIGEIREALAKGQWLFALDHNEYMNIYQWVRNEKKKGKDAGITGCRNGEYVVWHQDFSKEEERG